MNNLSINSLSEICFFLLNELESRFTHTPFGSCYLIGHCLAQGLSQAVFIAIEKSGHLILYDKNNKAVIYGTSKYKGKLVGFYHTWCTFENVNGDILILDPSLKYNKIYLKKEMNIKLNDKISDVFIGKSDIKFPVQYIEDEKLVQQSKNYLATVNNQTIENLIGKVVEKVKLLVIQQE